MSSIGRFFFDFVAGFSEVTFDGVCLFDEIRSFRFAFSTAKLTLETALVSRFLVGALDCCLRDCLVSARFSPTFKGVGFLVCERWAGFERTRGYGLTSGFFILLSLLSDLGLGWKDPLGFLAGKSLVGVRDYRAVGLVAFACEYCWLAVLKLPITLNAG